MQQVSLVIGSLGCTPNFGTIKAMGECLHGLFWRSTYVKKYPLDFIFEKDVAIDRHSDIYKAQKFIEKIQIIHQKVQEELEKSQRKYKERHDKHRFDHKFRFDQRKYAKGR